MKESKLKDSSEEVHFSKKTSDTSFRMYSVKKKILIESLQGRENEMFHFDLLLAPFGLQSLNQAPSDLVVGIIVEALNQDPRNLYDAVDAIDMAEELGCYFEGMLFPLLDPEFVKVP